MKNTNTKDVGVLLERSVLPLMAEMIKAMGEHSHRYESHIKEVMNKVDGVETYITEEKHDKKEVEADIRVITEISNKLYDNSITQEEAFNLLTNVISTFGERLTNLIDTNNQLVDYQKNQMVKMEEISTSFEENTSRLNTLTLAIKELTKEEDVDLSYHSENIMIGPKEDTGDLAYINKDTSSIHKVLEDEIKRLKDNTKG